LQGTDKALFIRHCYSEFGEADVAAIRQHAFGAFNAQPFVPALRGHFVVWWDGFETALQPDERNFSVVRAEEGLVSLSVLWRSEGHGDFAISGFPCTIQVLKSGLRVAAATEAADKDAMATEAHSRALEEAKTAKAEAEALKAAMILQQAAWDKELWAEKQKRLRVLQLRRLDVAAKQKMQEQAAALNAARMKLEHELKQTKSQAERERLLRQQAETERMAREKAEGEGRRRREAEEAERSAAELAAVEQAVRNQSELELGQVRKDMERKLMEARTLAEQEQRAHEEAAASEQAVRERAEMELGEVREDMERKLTEARELVEREQRMREDAERAKNQEIERQTAVLDSALAALELELEQAKSQAERERVLREQVETEREAWQAAETEREAFLARDLLANSVPQESVSVPPPRQDEIAARARQLELEQDLGFDLDDPTAIAGISEDVLSLGSSVLGLIDEGGTGSGKCR
jgi:hypothetical protein